MPDGPTQQLCLCLSLAGCRHSPSLSSGTGAVHADSWFETHRARVLLLMRAAVLRQLIQAHADGDEAAFRKAALQLASSESAAGHRRVADEIRQLAESLADNHGRAPKSPLSLARPPKELAGLLQGDYSEARLRDIVLTTTARDDFRQIIAENRQRVKLESWGVSPSRTLLLYGPPGCGKTLAAQVLAGELGLPAMTVRLDAVFSRYLGETAAHLRAVFDEMPRRPAVYLFDEFDAIGKTRGDGNDVGELRRVVIAFLQLMDSDRSLGLIVAATNDDAILDPALFRRFDVLMHFDLPTVNQLQELIAMRLAIFDLSLPVRQDLAFAAHGLSFAEAARSLGHE